jgi:5-methylthioadenosine/S-adenosylhomocysteine deaminase
MTRILIKDLHIVTLDDKGRLLERADLAIEDGQIAYVGSCPPAFQPDETVDGHNKAALPGLVNAHCHSPMTF